MSLISIIKQIFQKEDVTSNDRLGVYPQKVHVPAFLERRFLKSSRVLGLFAVVSTCVSLMLGVTLFAIPSMVSSSPVPFAYNHSTEMFEYIEPAFVRRSANSIITEQLLREYISLRYRVEPDIDVMTITWQIGNKFYWYNSYHVFSQFVATEQNRVMARIKASGYRREVYFRWSRFLRDYWWEVEFDTYEYHGWQRTKGERRRWRAYLKVGFDTRRKYPRDSYLLFNPLKFSVFDYRLTSIEIREGT